VRGAEEREEKEGKHLLLPASRCSLSLSRLSCTTVDFRKKIEHKGSPQHLTERSGHEMPTTI
jgi:hypothetical protein